MEDTNNRPAATEGAETAEPQAPTAAADTGTEPAIDYRDLYLRKAAEFDNYKKRVQQESSSLIRFANEDLLLSVLPIVDDLERSLKAGTELKDPAGFALGIELIRQKLLKILENHGVKPMEAVGKEFNVAYHDALLQVPRSDVPPHTVIDVVEQGYLLHDRVLRHAKVIVSTEAPDTAATAPSPQKSGQQ